jgi:hypothetical protein
MLAMFTKTMFALALLIGTAPNALAAPKHQFSPAHDGHNAAAKMSEPTQRDRVDFVVGNMLFVGFHELGHALVSQLRLPLLGRGEDAADSFATLALLDEGSAFSLTALVQAARGLFLLDRRDRMLGDALDFSDAHGLDKQRAFQIICLMVGSDAKRFKELADGVRLPEDRRQSCRAEYEDAKYAWHSLLKAHLRAADQPNSTIDITYEADDGKRDHYARSFRSMGLLEALAEYASSRYVLPRPITLMMKSCDDAVAWWNPATLTEGLCYEMAEDFVDLYQGYTDRTTSKTPANKLMARNAGRLGIAQGMATGSVEAAPGLPAALATRDRLETLALNLEGSAVALFAQTASGRVAADAKWRSAK